ncbi:unnamed protein product [Urochloa decumbens]|uniref:Rx N-terminal domain-containing protein n=1 Tax=Urochloa decumbens TaxID=240449 RepID=A0ABC9FNH9_9POAL
MDTILSAVLSELTTRSINFFISKISKPAPLDVEDCLHRVLLRAQVIMDEALGRHITNQAMLLQLVMLRDAMHQGYYMLDTFRYQHHDEEETKDEDVSRSSSLSIINAVKRLCLSSRGGLSLKELQETHDNLSNTILDVNELVLFLTSYPHLYRQPYSMHLQVANCIFDRQMEAQFIINFLLRTQPHDAEELEVLPIIGPSYVGKSTLVTHVCKDERGRLLLVIELIGDLNEEACSRLYFASKRCAPRGSKMIITSRFDSIVKFGTTRALTLKFLSQEAYWYLFKTLTFGSMDPEMHPKLLHLAMDMEKMKGRRRSYLVANFTAHLLRCNFDVHFWFEILAFMRRSYQKLVSRYGEHPFDLPSQNRPVLFGRMAASCEYIVVYQQHQHPLEEEVPKIKFQDVVCGSVKPHGKFDVLVWRSGIPPYYSYVFTCEIQGLKNRAVKRKRSMK